VPLTLPFLFSNLGRGVGGQTSIILDKLNDERNLKLKQASIWYSNSDDLLLMENMLSSWENKLPTGD
jgi:hypothetical protein